MNDWDSHDVWDVKEILDSGDPDRMETEAQGWREVESGLDLIEGRLTKRLELLNTRVSGGAFQVLHDEQGLLTKHVTDLRFNAQSNGVGWKGLSDTLREARPKIDQVATSYANTVVDPDGLISASTDKQKGARTSANAEARRIMTSADDSFQQTYANTSSEPPPYQGPGETGTAYQSGSGKTGSGVYVDPATGKYTAPATTSSGPGSTTPTPTLVPGDGPRTEFPTPSPVTGGAPGSGFGVGPGLTGGGVVSPTGPGTPGGTGYGPAGPLGGGGLGPYGRPGAPGGRGATPGTGTSRPSGRMGTPMGGGGHGGAGTGRSGARGSTPGKALPGRSPKSVYRDENSGGAGGRADRGKRREDEHETDTGNGPYDDELFQVDGRYTEGTIRPDAPVTRVDPGPYLGPRDIVAAEPIGVDLVQRQPEAGLVRPPMSDVDDGRRTVEEAQAASPPMNVVEIVKAMETMPPDEAQQFLAAERAKRTALSPVDIHHDPTPLIGQPTYTPPKPHGLDSLLDQYGAEAASAEDVASTPRLRRRPGR